MVSIRNSFIVYFSICAADIDNFLHKSVLYLHD